MNITKKVTVKIIKRFVDPKSHKMYGQDGEYEVDINTARRFHATGKARILDDTIANEVEVSMVTQGIETEETTSDAPGAPKVMETPLPEGFPEKVALEAAGYTTLESLSQKGVEMDLSKIDKMTKGKLNKIAIALEGLK